MNTDIPSHFASIINFGGLKGVYPVKKMSKWGSLTGMLVCFAIVGGLGLWAAWNAYSLYAKSGVAVLQRDFGDQVLPMLIICVIFALAGLAFGWSAFNNWKKSAALYRNGFAYRDRKGMKAWRLEDVAGLTADVTKHYRNGIYTGTTHVYTLWNRQGEKMTLNDTIQDVEELATQIREGVYPHIYGAAAQSYNAGRAVKFGPVTISKENGIEIKNKSYPWDEVKEVRVEKGYLKVAQKDGGWFSGASTPVSVIPNLDVLLSMIDQIVGIR